MEWVQRERKSKDGINRKDEPLDVLAKIRGIKDINSFLNPDKSVLNDPYKIKNIELASNRIIKAIKSGEKIVSSADCDVDGVTSTTMLIRYLKEYTDNVDYIYGERGNGHGIDGQIDLDFLSEKDYNDKGEIINESKLTRLELNQENVRKIKEADLLIIVDSSSNDVEACKKITEEYGTDIVIIDHHQIESINDYAILVNVQQSGDTYPNKHLSGAGMAFKVMEVMEDTLDSVDIWQYIDLVAVGMYADMMDVSVLENRYLISMGLRNIKNVGITRILKGAKEDFYKLTGDSIGFSIAPLINGTARLDNIKLAIDILLTDDDGEAKKLRLKMDKLNQKRKEIQAETAERYSKNINTNDKIIIVMDDKSSKGFNGLIAQQLSTEYKRPVIVGRLHNGTLSGSFRSHSGFKMKSFIQQSGFADEAMGHEQAGGIEIKEEKIKAFMKYIDENMPKLDAKQRKVVYDIELNADDVNSYVHAIEKVNRLAGTGFPKIIVRVNNITLEQVETIGKTMETRKFKTFDDVDLIKFKVNEDYASELGVFDTISVVGELKINEWFNFKTKQKTVTNQIMLTDYKEV